MASKLARAIRIVEKIGICLVFPIENRADPPSLWAALHPNEKMRWEWTDDGDNRVATARLLSLNVVVIDDR